MMGLDYSPPRSGHPRPSWVFMNPTVTAIHLCPASRAPLIAVDRASAVEEQGLAGDRHARANSRRQVLLMEQETLDALGLRPGDVREQVTVREIALDRLVFGARLRVGEARFEV